MDDRTPPCRGDAGVLGLLREVDPDDRSTWDGRFFLTLDVDWAPDFVIREVDQLLRSLDVPATWFITHESEAVDELRGHDRYEIGVHPNFVPALMGKPGAASVVEVIERARSMAPEARSFRCHSLVQSSPLLAMMKEAGFLFDSNVFLPYVPIGGLAPWDHGNGLTRVPYCWEDDTWMLRWCREPDDVISTTGIVVIDVHPIHVWMNAETLDRYEAAKRDMSDERLLRSLRNTAGPGVRDQMLSMIEAARSRAVR